MRPIRPPVRGRGERQVLRPRRAPKWRRADTRDGDPLSVAPRPFDIRGINCERRQSLRCISTKRQFPGGAATRRCAVAEASSRAEGFQDSGVGGFDLQSLPSFARFASATALHCLFLEYDDDESVLVLRSIEEPCTLATHHNQGRIPTRPATWMGRALAALHSLKLASSPMSALSERLPRRLPDALFLHRPDHALYCNSSYANLQAVRMMQSFPAFGALIDALAKEWRPSCLIHFDVKGDNILLSAKRGARSSWLIDWELAALGDPAWDVGSMFADYLGVWLWSIPITGEHPPAHYLSLARFPLTRLQPALRAFWRSYRLARGPDQSRRHSVFAIRYALLRGPPRPKGA